ncbi:MAG TPA: winged helix-turn-helix domain-containing protein [Steroidobacteraceae bacterium]|nr:winged helix-turn-helix domain-containing protein [Steroidobacteraceae bacterium]
MSAGGSGSGPDFRLGEWLVQPSLATIERGTEAVHVTPRSMAVLRYLADARGEVVSRNELLDAVWPGMSVTPDALSQCVVELRKAFHDDPKHPAVIQTIPKLGLRLLVPMTPVATASHDTTERRTRPRLSLPILAGMVVVAAIGSAVFVWSAVQRNRWRDPLTGADFTTVTDFIGSEEHAAISPDGRFIAFVSDRDGAWDVFVGQTGTGDFQNLTRGRIPELRNPAVRMLDFSPTAAEVLIWSSKNRSWSVPLVGGDLRTGPAGIAEIAWSRDRRRVVYHPAAPGDPLFVASADGSYRGQQVYVAPEGIHCHFPLWSHDGKTIYFVRGFVPDEMDLWQIRATGGEPQRLTWHNSRVSFPTLLDERTLLYLATSADGSGPWIHALDLTDHSTHRLKSAGNVYSSLAATPDGRRLIATVPHPTASLWSVRLTDGIVGPEAVTPIPIHTQRGVAPRLGPDSLLYRAPKAGTDALWKHEGTANARELWSGREGRVIAGPALSADGQRVAFTVQSRGSTWLYVMNSDGSDARRLAEKLDVRGAPAWSPDGKWIAIAALQAGEPRLFKLSDTGAAPVALTHEYALDPAWSPSGSFLVYTGADIGTIFEVHAIGADGEPHVIPKLELTRGSRRLAFLGADEQTLVILKGDQAHKEFWTFDLRSGAERALTNLGPGPVIGDFDVAADGRRIVFHRAREESDLALIEFAHAAAGEPQRPP